jgi:hypothetical protein
MASLQQRISSVRRRLIAAGLAILMLVCFRHADAGMIHTHVDSSSHSRNGGANSHKNSKAKRTKAAKSKKAKAPKSNKRGKRAKGSDAGSDVTEGDEDTGLTESGETIGTPESETDIDSAMEPDGLTESGAPEDTEPSDFDMMPGSDSSISEALENPPNNDFNTHFSPNLVVGAEGGPPVSDLGLTPPEGFGVFGGTGQSGDVSPLGESGIGGSFATGNEPGGLSVDLPIPAINDTVDLAEVTPLEFLNSHDLAAPVVSPPADLTGLDLAATTPAQHNNPEPASILLAALGGGCVAGARWHRRGRRRITST